MELPLSKLIAPVPLVVVLAMDLDLDLVLPVAAVPELVMLLLVLPPA